MPDKKLIDKEVCPYCHQDNEGYVKMFGRFYLRKDHFNGWNLYAGKGKPLPIKFCPICGRLLKIEQTQVYSIQNDFCGVPCEFMQDKINRLQAEKEELVGNIDKLKAELFDKTEQLNVELQAMRGAANSYKAENERLKKGWKADVILTANVKAEAVTEFAESLKSEIKALSDKHFEKQEHNICEALETLNSRIESLLKNTVS